MAKPLPLLQTILGTEVSLFQTQETKGWGRRGLKKGQRKHVRTISHSTQPILQLSTSEGEHLSPAATWPFSLGILEKGKCKGPTKQVTCTLLGSDKRIKYCNLCRWGHTVFNTRFGNRQENNFAGLLPLLLLSGYGITGFPGERVKSELINGLYFGYSINEVAESPSVADVELRVLCRSSWKENKTKLFFSTFASLLQYKKVESNYMMCRSIVIGDSNTSKAVFIFKYFFHTSLPMTTLVLYL